MSIICTKRFSSSQFSGWDRNKPCCEASDLQALRDGPLFAQIYDDACDVGFRVVNPTTGNEVTFVLFGEHCDIEGDTQFWILHPISEDVQKHPRLAGCEMTIFND